MALVSPSAGSTAVIQQTTSPTTPQVQTPHQWEQSAHRPQYSLPNRAWDVSTLVLSTVFFPIRLLGNLCGMLVFPAQFNPCEYFASLPLGKVYNPDGSTLLTPTKIQTKDGVKINAYDIRNPKAAEKPEEQKWIVYCNPNAASAEDLIAIGVSKQILEQTNCNLLMFNYRGTYTDDRGSRQATPLFGREMIYDGEAAVEYLLSQGVKEENIILQGHSLGGGVATQVKAKYPKAGLLNDRSFRSVSWAATKMLGLDTKETDSLIAKTIKVALSHIIGGTLWLTGWDFSSEEQLEKLKGRVLITHSDNDEVIQDEANLAHSPQAREFSRYEIGGSHGGSLMEGSIGGKLYPFLILALQAKEDEGYTNELHQAFYNLNRQTSSDISGEIMAEYNRLKGTCFDVHSPQFDRAGAVGDDSIDYEFLLSIIHRKLKALTS